MEINYEMIEDAINKNDFTDLESVVDKIEPEKIRNIIFMLVNRSNPSDSKDFFNRIFYTHKEIFNGFFKDLIKHIIRNKIIDWFEYLINNMKDGSNYILFSVLSIDHNLHSFINLYRIKFKRISNVNIFHLLSYKYKDRKNKESVMNTLDKLLLFDIDKEVIKTVYKVYNKIPEYKDFINKIMNKHIYSPKPKPKIVKTDIEVARICDNVSQGYSITDTERVFINIYFNSNGPESELCDSLKKKLKIINIRNQLK